MGPTYNAAEAVDIARQVGLVAGALASPSTRFGKVCTKIAAVSALSTLSYDVYSKWSARGRWSVTISSNDELYSRVLAWIARSLPKEQQIGLLATTNRVDSNNATVELLVDGKGSVHTVPFPGGKARVWLGNTNSTSLPKKSSDRDKYYSKDTSASGYVRLETTSALTRDKLIKHLDTLLNSVAVPHLHVATSWGSWIRHHSLTPRTLESVVLTDNLVELVKKDLQNFLDSEKAYTSVGVPWHRGYLLYGPPGTGKTSLAAALATTFSRDLYCLPTSDLEKDASLLDLIAEVGPRSILLIEDADVVHGAQSRDDAECSGVSLSGLLNALDGVHTPYGLVTIMTTNNKDLLDSALIRPGRIDKQVHFDYLTLPQLSDMLSYFCPAIDSQEKKNSLSVLQKEFPQKIAPSEVVEIIKSNLINPDSTLELVVNYILNQVHT